MTIGEKIIELRKKEKLSQEKLAEKLGISRQTLSSYENDITTPDLAQSKKICEVLDVSLDELVGIEKNIFTNKLNKVENLAKKQNRLSKIIIVTIYLALLITSIYIVIHYATGKNLTSKYQIDFTCIKKSKDRDLTNEVVNIVLGNSNYDIKNFVDKSYFESYKDIRKEGSFYIYGAGNYLEDAIYAGDTYAEAFENLNAVKNFLIDNGFKCK